MGTRGGAAVRSPEVLFVGSGMFSVRNSFLFQKQEKCDKTIWQDMAPAAAAEWCSLLPGENIQNRLSVLYNCVFVITA